MSSQSPHSSEEKQSDIKSLAKNIQEKPGLYIASVLFIAVIALATVLFKLSSSISDKEKAAEYAFALEEESPSERSIALAAVAESDSPYRIEALYLSGVSAFEAKEYDTAIETLTRIQKENSDFQFAPDAVSVIGLAYEAKGEYEKAISQYQSVQTTWPDSFSARIQPNNMGRCYEEMENIADAVTAYQEQLAAFPGSNEAQRAQISLNRLRIVHPDAFESEEEELPVVSDLISDLPEIIDTPEQN
jgi:tetratricopeptide (TPR) repeat protein